MIHRPVTVTSPTHALGISSIVTQGLLAIALLIGVNSSDALAAVLSVQAEEVLVPLLMFTAAVGALGAIFVVANAQSQGAEALGAALRVEMVCKIMLAGTTLLYAFALTNYYGFLSETPSLQIYAWISGLGFVARAAQIAWDLRAVTRARKAGCVADPSPLGEPNEGG